MIFDTHTHYDEKAFDEDRDELLKGLAQKGIGQIVAISADIGSPKIVLDLSKKYDFMYAALGIHPSDVAYIKDEDLLWIEEHASDEKVVAIGEIGLDYHWPEPGEKLQKKWFREQIELAKRTKLPIVVHSRDAAKDTMDIIKETRAYDCGGVIHCYSYSADQAKEYAQMGFYIGVGGVVRKLKQTVEELSLDNIVLETDCPYLSPDPNRGKRNDSSNLIYVVEEIAKIKNISAQEVIDTTEKNARALYNLREK